MTGQELRQIREAHGLTRQTLADLLGYANASYIARLENSTAQTKEKLRISPRLEKLIRRIFPEKKMDKSS
jgi:transcriptional regulator with XRE-family HTH domain